MNHSLDHPRSNPEPNRETDFATDIPRLTMHLLRQSMYTVGGGMVIARLWRMSPDSSACSDRATYAVGLEGFGGRSLCRVGQDAARAEEVYMLLVRHTVTPCTLQDVMEDMAE